MARKYRRKSASSSILKDTVYMGSRLPWWGALIFGVLIFVLLYFILPAWLESKLGESSGSNIYPIIEAIFGRRIHWLQWLGIACGLTGCFFAIRNYFICNHAGYKERSLVSIIAKLLGRNIE